MKRFYLHILACLFFAAPWAVSAQQLEPVTPPALRGSIDHERTGTHDANQIRTRFYNYGMVGDYVGDNDLSVYHSIEVPKGTGVNYSDGVTPFVLARVKQANGLDAEIMLTGYRERQATSPVTNKTMRFEPRPGYVETDPSINKARAIAISNDPRTWPGAADADGNLNPASDPTRCWVDKVNDTDDPGWCGSWNGFFGKRPNADQESFFVMDDQYYDAWNFYPDTRDKTRRGLGLRVEVRGFQWANPQAQNVIFWHYDIVNEGTTTYDDIVFGLYMDSGVGGATRSCDGVYESDDDNAFYNREFGLNLVYTWDKRGHGVGLSGNCESTGYLGYAYLETPGNPFNNADDDNDGLIDERRDGGEGQRIEGQDAIRAYVNANYNMATFTAIYGPLEDRPAYVAGVWYTGDEDLDWNGTFNDTGADGIFSRGEPGDDDYVAPDTGEKDGKPTAGEQNFDKTDINESDMIGLTGFKMNRIVAGEGAPSSETDNIVFYMQEQEWPRRLYNQFTSADPNVRFDQALVLNYNIGFLFASGPFRLEAGRRERFSLALAYGEDLTELESHVSTVQSIYNANYQFATPPPVPTVKAYAGDGRVTLVWDNAAEKGIDPVTNRNDFEGYRIYRSTDPNFLDPKVISNARGTGPIGNGRPLAQFDLVDDVKGFSNLTVQGVAYWLGEDKGITHTFVDSTVTNGQTYYYAVTAYDYGSEEFGFYPSENAITISRTLRGGTILPTNAVEVRPNAPVPGYVTASVDQASISHAQGDGKGSVAVRVLNPANVPDGHTMQIEFKGLADSVRAMSYLMKDLDTGEQLFDVGVDLEGKGIGPVGAGVQPIISTLVAVEVDTVASGFMSGSNTNAKLTARYSSPLSINQKRPGYPENIKVTFADTPLDTSIAAIGAPARPAKFKVTTEGSGMQLDFTMRDTNNDGTLSAEGEFIDVLTVDPLDNRKKATWRLSYNSAAVQGTPVAPGAGDTYLLDVNLPFSTGDVFTFNVVGERVEKDLARTAFEEEEPYVVPNPYVASASFEPERFAVSGRGERRMEFRAIPADATVRIYTVRGDLVQTLHHDGSHTGTVAWDLRSKDNLEVAPGLYIFHVDADDLGEFVGKFAIIK